jgi:hypothetical protein
MTTRKLFDDPELDALCKLARSRHIFDRVAYGKIRS